MSQCGLKLEPVQKIRWTYSDIEGMPDVKSGIYAFWCSGSERYIYIGQAKSSIKKRLKQHQTSTSNPALQKRIRLFGEFLEIQFVSVEKNQLDDIEKRLIKTFKPLANREHNPNYH